MKLFTAKVSSPPKNNKSIPIEFAIRNSYIGTKTLNIKIKKPVQWKIKRIMDIFLSILALIFSFPLMLITSIAIKIDSKGPVFFKQKRVGFLGKEFFMYKFRSMKDKSEESQETLEKCNEVSSGMFKLSDDPRTTRIGKFIRKYSIDELPQFLNVLNGDMSIVGPRPPITKELKHYKSWHFLRFTTLPGITGMWQVNGRSQIKSFDAVVKLDWDYISNWSLLLDIKLLLKTIPVVLFGKDTA